MYYRHHVRNTSSAIKANDFAIPAKVCGTTRRGQGANRPVVERDDPSGRGRLSEGVGGLMIISKIEVNFALPVDLTDGEMQRIDGIVNDAARRTETPEIVHWAAGCGCKPNWSKTDCKVWGMTPTDDSPDSGEPTWDDSVFYIETATRERYATDTPFKPHEKRKTNAERFCELLETIDNRCAAADGPVAPTLTEATADELRKLYLFADRIRKEYR